MKRLLALLLALVLAFTLMACYAEKVVVEGFTTVTTPGTEPDPSYTAQTPTAEDTPDTPVPDDHPTPDNTTVEVIEGESYTSKEGVALYIHTFGCLPPNFMTKKEAEKLGWEGGSLEPYAPGMCIGGNRFGNYEGLLPEKEGRTYTECDIDTLGASKRGAKRIVFSNDGLIYYTDDHYESFELLYGEE